MSERRSDKLIQKQQRAMDRRSLPAPFLVGMPEIPPAGGASSTGRSTFLALLSHVQQYSESLTGLPAYYWAQARMNAGAAEVKPGGKTSDRVYKARNLVFIGSNDGVGVLNEDAPQLVFPTNNATLPGTVTPGSPPTIAITFGWTDVDGGGNDFWIGVGEPPATGGSWDIYHEENDALGLVTSHEVAGLPADSRTLHVRVWNDTEYNEYQFEIEEGPDRRAIGAEDVNALERGDDVEEPREYGTSGWIPATKTALTDPILVIMHQDVDADGHASFSFVRGGGGSDIEIGSPDVTQDVVEDGDFDGETTCELTLDKVTLTLTPVTIQGTGYFLIKSIT